MKKKDETKAIRVKRYKNRMKSADKAPLEVVLAGEEPDTYRFTASRKVTVS